MAPSTGASLKSGTECNSNQGPATQTGELILPSHYKYNSLANSRTWPSWPNTVHLSKRIALLISNGGGGGVAAPAKREVAHLTLDCARVSSAAAGDDAFLQDLLDRAVMKGLFVSRGG